MNYPNKIYVSEWSGVNAMGKSHFVIITAASDSATAREYVKSQIGFDMEPTWLMNAVHPTLYTSDGRTPLATQVKILSNNNYYHD